MADELWVGGLTTDPEIRKLKERFTDMASLRGTTITHETIEETIGVTRDSNRYRTITSRWRKIVAKETGVELRGDLTEVVGVGFRVLSDGEQVSFGADLRVRAGRKIRHSHRAVANTDEAKLTPEQARERSHALQAAKMIHTAMIESRKFLPKAPEPPKQRPQGENAANA